MMITPIIPSRLRSGDRVRVVAPSCSLALISGELREVAAERFEQLGLELTFGAHVETCDAFDSSPIEERVADLHAAFADPDVRAVITVIGGYNSNQLLPYLDWELIAANPKIFCGYSDITALTCSIWAKTGLVTFSGPHYSTFGMVEHLEQTVRWFEAALMGDDPTAVHPAATWSDDAWYLDQHDRRIEKNDGFWVLPKALPRATWSEVISAPSISSRAPGICRTWPVRSCSSRTTSSRCPTPSIGISRRSRNNQDSGGPRSVDRPLSAERRDDSGNPARDHPEQPSARRAADPGQRRLRTHRSDPDDSRRRTGTNVHRRRIN